MLETPKSDGTVGKALQVLDQVAGFERPVRFSELLASSPFPKPTLYRFVQTLTNQGMLAFDGDRQTYSLGMRLVRLAHSAWRDSTLAPLGRPHLDALSASVGEAVHLAQFDNGHVIFVDKRKATDHFETLAQAGKVAPGYCTGVGKAILAFVSDRARERAFKQQSFMAFTPATITEQKTLEAELEQIRVDGVAYDREEHEHGIISIACPILIEGGQVIGAISIATSTSRHTVKELETFRDPLLATARRIGADAEIWQVPGRS